jgi:hypothetical protein
MCSPMPDTPYDELGNDVPPVCPRWPKCEGEHGEGSHFNIDEWRWSDSTCDWPKCAEGLNA